MVLVSLINGTWARWK